MKSLYVNSSKSRKSGGSHQSRRPDFSYGFNLTKNLNLMEVKNLTLTLDYKYTGKYLDWDGSKNSFQKSTDLLDLVITKDLDNYSLVFDVRNLLNERYEKPATYEQDGRQFSIKYVKFY